MLHFISYHAPGVLGADRPDERSVEAPLERISQAIETVGQRLNIFGRTPDRNHTGNLIDGTIIVLYNRVPALRLIAEVPKQLRRTSRKLGLPYSKENVFPYVAD